MINPRRSREILGTFSNYGFIKYKIKRKKPKGSLDFQTILIDFLNKNKNLDAMAQKILDKTNEDSKGTHRQFLYYSDFDCEEKENENELSSISFQSNEEDLFDDKMNKINIVKRTNPMKILENFVASSLETKKIGKFEKRNMKSENFSLIDLEEDLK